MKLIRPIFVTAVLLLGVLGAQLLTAQAIPEDLRAAIQARGAAARQGDGETWGRHTTDDCVLTSVDGIVRTKAQEIAEMKMGRPSDPAGSLTNERIQLFGNTAIRTGRTGNVRFTAVWVKNPNGVWQVAAAHRTRIAAP